MKNVFGNCEICGANDWSEVYAGPVRDGAFGSLLPDAVVARCAGCQADRLAENCCPDGAIYESAAYRAKLKEALDTQGYYTVSDPLQIFTSEVLHQYPLRGKTVADVGCAGGSFLDHVAGTAGDCIAIEPAGIYHDSLRQRGYSVYSYASEATGLKGQIDCCVSIQVIEHVLDPRSFLADMNALLKPDGIVVLSTPNRNDILMSLLPETYPAFFYRAVHRWYFDRDSLANCARLAGFEVIEARHVHRYGMANALRWLRDNKPTGSKREETITPMADGFWKSYLESKGLSDCLYMVLRKAG